MGAKSIIKRYMERNRSILPENPDDLRQHIAGVASEARLKIAPKELDELLPSIPEKKGKKARIKEAGEKSDNDTSKEI